MNSVLVLAPHTDDGELGCGGTIAKLIEEGYKVVYVAFSTCRRALPADVEQDILEKEVKRAVPLLGVLPEDIVLFDYDVRQFKTERQSILEDMVLLNKKHNPIKVFVPSPADMHQDHQVISEEGLRAFKNITVLGYEMPWNNIAFNTRAFMKLQEKHVLKKVSALKEYKSQLARNYITEEFIFSLARVRGVQIGTQYAESFEVIRLIL
ncbi:MAG: PIG-L deacetylase family protein [Chitinophagaceae bacterium]